MKSRARFSWHRDSGLDFVQAFKSRSQIFKQGSRRLGESRILPFTTPLMGTGELNSGGVALLKTSIPSRESLYSRNTSPPGSVNGYW